MCKFHGPNNVLSTRNAELACTTTLWSMLGRKRSARVEPMARVGSRQAMYQLICLYQVVPLPLLKALLFAGSTAFSLELMKGKKVLFLSSTSSRFLGRTHYLVRYI